MDCSSDENLTQINYESYVHVKTGNKFLLRMINSADDKRGLYRNYIVNGQDKFSSLCKQMNDIYKIDLNAIANIPEAPVDCSNPNLIKFINYIQVCMQSRCDTNNKFFPQFYPMHNHDDYKVTNNGVYPGGQLTFIQADSPYEK